MEATRSMDGETVDLIALRVYGDTSMSSAVLEANPGLSALGPVLPRGTKIALPEKQTPTKTGVNLWD